MFSKKLAKILPGKMLVIIQNIVCTLLLLVICFLSIGPIFTIDVKLDAEAKDQVYDILAEIDEGNKKLDIPETIEVDMPFIIRSVGAIGNVVSVAMDMLDDAADIGESASGLGKVDGVEDIESAADNVEKIEENVDDIEEKAKSVITQDLIDLVAFVVAIAMSFEGNVILGICHIFLLIMVPVICLVAIISALIAVIALLVRIKHPEKACHRIARSLASVIGLFPLLFLIMVMIPEVQFASNIFTILALCCVGLGVSLAAARLKYYEMPDFKYLNVLQIVSAVSLGAFLLFFFSIINSNIVQNMMEGFGDYALNELEGLFNNSSESPNILPLILVPVFVIILISVFSYMTQIVTRLACMSKSKKDNHIVTVTFNLLVAIIPFVLMNGGNFKLEMTDEENTAFLLACVGLGVMFVAEIVQAVLNKTLCAATSRQRRMEIVTGAYMYVGEFTEEAPAEEAPVEEVPAEEAPVEEAPAEEAPVEEAPAEEAPVEEAPAEEAPVEEAPVEEAPAEEAPAEEAPVEEAPAEEAPVEEAPLEEAPVEEAPVEEAPIEEKTKQ